MARAALVRKALVFLLPVAFALYPVPSGALYGLLGLAQPGRRRLPGSKGVVALVICLVLSAVLSDRGLGVVVIATLVVPAAVLLWVIVTRLDGMDVWPAVCGVFLMLLLNLAVSIYQVHVIGLGRAAGVMLHANTLGSVAAVVLFVFLPSPGTHRLGAWRAIGALVSAALLAYSASRGAVLGAVAGLVAMVAVAAIASGAGLSVWKWRQLRSVVLVVVLVGGVILVARPPLVPMLARLPALDSVADPLGRPLLWSVALELIAHRPFLGFGPLAWQEFAPLVEPMIRPHVVSHAHNQYLELALWAGFAGLVCLAWIGTALSVRLWRGAKVNVGWAAAGFASMAAIATVSAFDAAGSRLEVQVLWVLVVGLALVMTDERPTSSGPTMSPDQHLSRGEHVDE